MATPRKSTIVRISDEHRDWVDRQRDQAGGLSRDAFVRWLIADAMAQWEADQTQTQIRSPAAGAPWKKQHQRAWRPPADGGDIREILDQAMASSAPEA